MTESLFIDITRTVFPVLALETGRDGEMARADFFGTAFAVAPGVFMTAAHVVTAAQAAGVLAVGGPGSADGRAALGAVRVEKAETWSDRDVALLFGNFRGLTELKLWLTRPVQLLMDLSSFGYPHAVTRNSAGDRLNVMFRAYKGHVVTTRKWDRLPGEPSVYEISCPFPVGMSGAPLLLNHDGVLAVAGVVLGTDTVEYGGVAQNVGIAMTADQIATLRSETLGETIGDRLGLLKAVLRPHGDVPQQP